MNLKRILIIFVVLVVVFGTLSVASAGLFDFLGGDGGNGTVDCNIIKSSYNGKLKEQNGGLGTFQYDGHIALDLGNATDAQINTIKKNIESGNNTYFFHSDDVNDNLTLTGNNGIGTSIMTTIEGKTLTVDYETGFISMMENGGEGNGTISYGNITMIGENNITLTFHK